MKKYLIIALAALAVAMAPQVRAANPGMEKTIKGEGACAKCLLKDKDAKECQLTVTTEENGKKVTYYIENNDVAKKFGKPVCEKRQKIAATGEVKLVGDRHELVASKIELVKEPVASAVK